MTTQAEWPICQITPTLRVVQTDREWIVQNAVGGQNTIRWTDRSYLTTRTALLGELNRLAKASGGGIREQADRFANRWLSKLPARHPFTVKAPSTVLDMLEAMGPEIHTTGDLRDDLPLIVQHGPLKYRDRWNARFDC